MREQSTPTTGISQGIMAGADAACHDADSPLILIVDDDALNRTILGAMLHKLGYRYRMTQNGREAVDATRGERFAAVLMDCLMPEMDGYTATRAIRDDERSARAHGRHRHLPVIAVTAVAIDGARERCIAAGMDDYLSKPVVMQTLDVVLRRWITEPQPGVSWTLASDPGEAVPDHEIVNLDALDSLRVLGGEDGDAFVAGVVDDFIADLAARFDSLGAAITDSNRTGVMQALHSIAGCAAMVGAMEIERLARSAPAGDASADLADLADLAERLEVAFTRTHQILEAHVVSAAAAGAA